MFCTSSSQRVSDAALLHVFAISQHAFLVSSSRTNTLMVLLCVIGPDLPLMRTPR
jgi:hypothetical protein